MSGLNRVTITGADDLTSLEEMGDVSAEFPFVEWGILVSKSREGTPRYPGRDWCSNLAAVAIAMDDDLLRISMHVCGSWARQAFSGQLEWAELPAVRVVARRIQINGSPGVSGFPSPSLRHQFIFQYPRSAHYITAARAAGFDAVPLLDESGGEGITRTDWPDSMPGVYCGYAGGIGPDNVLDVIGKIDATRKSPYWIDMEGRVRTDDRLDMKKVRTVLRLAAPYIKTEQGGAR